jgi:hypothetical protein
LRPISTKGAHTSAFFALLSVAQGQANPMRLDFTLALVPGCDSNSQNHVRSHDSCLCCWHTERALNQQFEAVCVCYGPDCAEIWHWDCNVRRSDKCLWIMVGVITDKY